MTRTAARQPAAGRPEAKLFQTRDIGYDEQQHQEEYTSGQESRFATPCAIATVCTLLAMFLVAALVWVHVRETFQLGRVFTRKRCISEEEAKRSKSTNRDRGSRTGKVHDWGERRREDKGVSVSQNEGLTKRKRSIPAKDQEDAARGSLWPAPEGRSSSVSRRAGACALQQRGAATVKGQHQQREDEQDVRRESEQAREWHSEGTGSRETEKEMKGPQRKNYRQQQQEPRLLCPAMGADVGENTTRPLSTTDRFREGFQQREVGETTENYFPTGHLIEPPRNSYDLIQPPWHSVIPALNCRDKDGASRTIPNMAYSHENKVQRYEGSGSDSNSPAAGGETSNFREEGTPTLTCSSSANEEEDMLSPSELRDQRPLTSYQRSTQPDLPWFSTRTRSTRSSAAIVSLQQQYATKCRDMFARLGEVVQEAPARAQTPAGSGEKPAEQDAGASRSLEGTSEANSGSSEQQCRQEEELFRFERPGPLGEEALTEAEQLLTQLEEMFADIKKDFKDNQPGNITCMIRCCNSLLEMDGLMVLSRCKKVPRLMQKAQSIIETVVPCIWSS